MDSIGVIGLVAGLWFALSPADEQRTVPAWLGWLLAGACAVLLLAGTLTEPLVPPTGGIGTTDWTSDPTPDSTQQGGIGGRADSPAGTPGPFGATCSLTCPGPGGTGNGGGSPEQAVVRTLG